MDNSITERIQELNIRTTALELAISTGTPPDAVVPMAQKFLDFLRPAPATATGTPDAK